VLRNLTLAFVASFPCLRTELPPRLSASGHLDLLPEPSPSPRSPSPTRSSFSRSAPPRTQLISLLPALPYLLTLVQSGPVWSGLSHDASFPSQSLGATSRSSVILIPLHLKTLHSPFDPRWNRWNTPPPYPPPLSLTCRVDTSSSRAHLGVSLTLHLPFFAV
jgi:hypothetical protein